MRLRHAGYGALAVALASSPAWGPPLLRPLKFFGVRRVEVVGARYAEAEAVVSALQLRPGASVFDDLDAVAARVKARGGVAEVVVRRRLPGTLLVRVREVEPVALAAGPEGLVAVSRDGRPLPFDVVRARIDAPIVESARRRLLEGLAVVQATDPMLYSAISTAQLASGDVVLQVDGGRLLLGSPVDPSVVRSVSAVRRDLVERSVGWRELDGRFGGWVVVRRAPVEGRRGSERSGGGGGGRTT